MNEKQKERKGERSRSHRWDQHYINIIACAIHIHIHTQQATYCCLLATVNKIHTKKKKEKKKKSSNSGYGIDPFKLNES